MICDWLGAGIVYSKQKVAYDKPYSEPLKYYNKCKKERIFYPETQKLIEYYLNIIELDGINVFCKNVRRKGYIYADYIGETIN